MKHEKNPTKRPVVIPRYETIGIEIIRNNIRTAEITHEQYIKAFENC